MQSVAFHSWADFRRFGINFLTGESCALGMRLLCDLSEEGCTIVRAFLGLPHDAPFSRNWNSMVDEKPAVASVMLPRGLFKELARYIAFTVLNHPHVVISPDGSVHGYCDGFIEGHGMTLETARERIQGDWYTNPAFGRTSGVSGDRCVHAMSGRTD